MPVDTAGSDALDQTLRKIGGAVVGGLLGQP
jgi:hypothetical protein